jgi:hypothetical protein
MDFITGCNAGPDRKILRRKDRRHERNGRSVLTQIRKRCQAFPVLVQVIPTKTGKKDIFFRKNHGLVQH